MQSTHCLLNDLTTTNDSNDSNDSNNGNNQQPTASSSRLGVSD